MTRFDLIQLYAPSARSPWDLLPVGQALAVLAYARPVPAIVCVTVAGLFLFQAFRHLREARQEQGRADASRRKVMWLRASMALGFLLAAAWIALLGLELRYPDPPSPTWPTPAQDIRQ